MFGKLLGAVTNKAVNFIEDPIGETVKTVTQPIRDGLDVIDGLTEGELRVEASLRLGADVVSGMALSEIIEWYENQ